MVFNGRMRRLQKENWGNMRLRRRVEQILENERAFKIGVICLGLLPVALLLAALFLN
jgi:hypothetical protein